MLPERDRYERVRCLSGSGVAQATCCNDTESDDQYE
jgi:hypothetical protein